MGNRSFLTNNFYLVARCKNVWMCYSAIYNWVFDSSLFVCETIPFLKQTKTKWLPSLSRTVRPPYQVSKTFSSSMTLEILSLGVLSMRSPIVILFLPLCATGTSRTCLHIASAASGPHSELRKASLSFAECISKNWMTLQQIVSWAVI